MHKVAPLDSWHQFSQLIAAPGTGATGISAIRLTHQFTLSSTMITYQGACLADETVKWRIVLHEVRSRHTHFSTVLQFRNVFEFCAVAFCSLIVFSRLQANSIAFQTVLNALLDFHFTHLVSSILYHCSSPFQVEEESKSAS